MMTSSICMCVESTGIVWPQALFSHLPQYDYQAMISEVKKMALTSTTLHNGIVQLGLQLASGSIRGSNACCEALLLAFKGMIANYTPPSGKMFDRDLKVRKRARRSLSYLTLWRLIMYLMLVPLELMLGLGNSAGAS